MAEGGRLEHSHHRALQLASQSGNLHLALEAARCIPPLNNAIRHKNTLVDLQDTEYVLSNLHPAITLTNFTLKT
jgi:hypothetical protein